jgi:hypothetical protein
MGFSFVARIQPHRDTWQPTMSANPGRWVIIHGVSSIAQALSQPTYLREQSSPVTQAERDSRCSRATQA